MASIVDSAHASNGGRVLTGIKGLDCILRGGLIRGNSLLIQGPPGSAKTTLGIQTLVNGINRFNENAILLSMEQYPEQIIRDSKAFGWDLAGAIQENRLRIQTIRPHDLYHSLTGEDSQAIVDIREAKESLGAKRILVDSITHFYRTQQPVEEQDRVFTEFLQALRQIGLTALLIAELPNASANLHSHITYVADAVINTHYDYDPRAGYRKRWLEVVKSRGQECLEGRHPMRINGDGLQVYPRIIPAGRPAATSERKICSTGINGLDELLGGGIAEGSYITVAGPEGTAKTTIGAQFLAAGCDAGESCVLLTCQETSDQFLDNMTSRGLDLSPHALKGRLEILHLPTIGLCLLETYYRLQKMIAERRVRRIVIDSVNDLMRNATDPLDEQYFLSLYGDLFRHEGVTVMSLQEIRPVEGLDSFASVSHASMADTVVLLGLAEKNGRLVKSIVVMKSRNAIADDHYHELVLTKQGVQIRPRSW